MSSSSNTIPFETLQLIFRKCYAFVHELNDVFGPDHPELALYHRLMKEGPKHEKALNNHIDVFKSALLPCSEAIKKMDINDVCEKIAFSQRVFVPVKQICVEADDANQSIIFNHLQVILALIDPDGSEELRTQLLMEAKKEKEANESDKEGAFLNSFLGEVETNLVDKSFEGPMQAAASLLMDGTLMNLAQRIQDGISNGNLDLNKLVSKVTQQMETTGSTEQVSSMMNMMSGLMGMPSGQNPMDLIQSIRQDEDHKLD